MRVRIDVDTSAMQRAHVHGRHAKDLIVLHETVSPDVRGLGDVLAVERYLAGIGYGIHGVIDAEGFFAWARGLGDATFWQAGGVNERSVGLEQVSNVMLRSPDRAVRRLFWTSRHPQLRRTAQAVACVARAHGIPLHYSDADAPGVTSHYSVSLRYAASQGHTDCWPVHLGGYYPALEVIALARYYRRGGLRF